MKKAAGGTQQQEGGEKKALDALPTLWLWFWRVEILVVLGSVGYWMFGYRNYLTSIFGAHTEGIDREYFLLLQGCITIFCCYV